MARIKLVQGLVEDQAEQALFLAQCIERMAVVVEQRIAVLFDQAGPAVLLRHDAGLAVRCLGALVSRLEEQQVGEMFEIVAVAHAAVAEDVAVVPKFTCDIRWTHLSLLSVL